MSTLPMHAPICACVCVCCTLHTRPRIVTAIAAKVVAGHKRVCVPFHVDQPNVLRNFWCGCLHFGNEARGGHIRTAVILTLPTGVFNGHAIKSRGCRLPNEFAYAHQLFSLLWTPEWM